MLTALLAASAVAARPDGDGTVSVRDGAFTGDQAQRGERGFRQTCGKCHTASAFKGSSFTRAWSGRAAYDLFEEIRTTMPSDGPGRLSRQQYADIVAYLFHLNGYPSGARELPEDEEGLKKVKIEGP
jgi:mono/diheme cytochrome c family protein